VDEKNKPLSETITDAQIANLLGEHGLEADAENIDCEKFKKDGGKISGTI